MTLAASLSQLVEAWARLYESKIVSAGVTFVHLGGVLLGGGFAIAADRLAIRTRTADPEERVHCLSELHSLHRPVLIGLALAFLSGLLMFAAHFDVYLTRPLYWIKMAVVVTLVGNGVLLWTTETRLSRGDLARSSGWPRLRGFARASAFLWFGALFFGTALLAI